MTMVLNKKYIGKGSYRLFISNRILRLYPSYIATVILTIIASILNYYLFDNWFKLTPWIDNFDILDITTYIVLFFTNLLIIGQDMVMFLGVDNSDGILYFTNNFQNSDVKLWGLLLVPQAWSISLELMFYILAPFIVRKSIQVIVIFIILSILLRLLIYFSLGWFHDPWTYRFFPTELALFLFGSIAFKIYENIHSIRINKKVMMSIVLTYFLIIVFYQFLPEMSHLKNWFLYIISIGIIPILFFLTKNNKIDSLIGELSYPVYLIHILAISFVSKFVPESYHSELAIIISIIAAIFLVKFVEEPIDKIRQKRVKSKLK